MNTDDDYKWAHKTLDEYPYDEEIVGVSILDESPGLTGIYLRTASGGLWPARTVDREHAEHHEFVVAAWMTREGVNLDLRSVP